MEDQSVKSFIESMNQRPGGRQKLSDEDMDKVSGGSCVFYHNYDIVGPIYVNNDVQGAIFECKDCGDCLFAKKKVFDKEYKQVRYAEFMKTFGEQFGN